MTRIFPRASIRSLSIASGLFTASKMESAPLTTRSYTPSNPDSPFPYSAQDMNPLEQGNDLSFYRVPRFVTHIDDNAIISLRMYYDKVLPRKGRILDFCSSWISHYPPEVERAAVDAAGELEVFGTGMNKSELSQNPILKKWWIQDLNSDPEVHLPVESTTEESKLDASTCVVSIDYLTSPVEVLSSIRAQTKYGGKVHLAISNRCFPTKVVGRWLRVREEERLDMVGDYLWYSGWRDVEIVEVVKGGWTKDPLWIVRASNTDTG